MKYYYVQIEEENQSKPNGQVRLRTQLTSQYEKCLFYCVY